MRRLWGQFTKKWQKSEMVKELQQREARQASRVRKKKLYESASWLTAEFPRLWSRYQADTPPHALLIVGREGLGKSLLAETLVMGLLCLSEGGHACGVCQSCRWLESDFHPDLYKIAEEGEIKVDTIRKIHHFTHLTAEAKGKVILIQNADQMNINAANSLLKVLEEPPAGVRFILVSSEPEKLPITVRSRCQIERMTLPSRVEAEQFLQKFVVSKEDRAELFAISFGAPFKALEYWENGYLEKRQKILSSLVQLLEREGELPKLVAELLKEDETLLFDLLFFLLNASFKLDRQRDLVSFTPLLKMLSHFSPQHRLQQYEKLIEINRMRSTQTRLDWELEAWFTLF